MKYLFIIATICIFNSFSLFSQCDYALTISQLVQMKNNFEYAEDILPPCYYKKEEEVRYSEGDLSKQISWTNNKKVKTEDGIAPKDKVSFFYKSKRVYYVTQIYNDYIKIKEVVKKKGIQIKSSLDEVVYSYLGVNWQFSIRINRLDSGEEAHSNCYQIVIED